ncbi:MAG: FdtA/QdtA family cupin domain-containing protein [Bacteroidaceae bacterium]|nr:FdtA/QdtA family cupin domain-containing protein [Bacteroidaceae bacterium]
MDIRFTIRDCCIVDIPSIADHRGVISVMDKELPFCVKRIFWLHHITEGKDRGAHALLDSTEIIVAVHGSFAVDLDDAVDKTCVILDSPEKGLIIRPGVWFRTHSYENDGVTLVIAEDEYSRDKYTYDYEEFRRLRGLS